MESAVFSSFWTSGATNDFNSRPVPESFLRLRRYDERDIVNEHFRPNATRRHITNHDPSGKLRTHNRHVEIGHSGGWRDGVLRLKLLFLGVEHAHADFSFEHACTDLYERRSGQAWRNM